MLMVALLSGVVIVMASQADPKYRAWPERKPVTEQ
jgi:hypothetical protein